MHQIVTDRIQEYTGINADAVCICSNHTHRGAPVLDSPEINCYADAAYKDVFFRLVADAVILAYKRLDESEVKVKYGKAEVKGIAFNRNCILEDGSYVTHVQVRKNVKAILGGTDDTMTYLLFEKEGKIIGAISNFACHQDCTKGIYRRGYTGDYASILAKELKNYYGNDFVSIFLLGACGDINSTNHNIAVVQPENKYQIIGSRLATALYSTACAAEPVSSEISVIKECLRVPRRVPQGEDVTALIHKYSKRAYPTALRNFLHYQASNDAEYTDLYIQGIRIGEVLIVAFPGEIYVKVGLELKERSPFAKTIVAENCNSYCGYIPTKEAFKECSDLYEASLCYHSCHVPEACDMFIEKALEIGQKLL